MFSVGDILFSFFVSAVGLLLALSFRSAPPRLGLYICLCSMFAVVVPWTSLGNLFGNSPYFIEIPGHSVLDMRSEIFAAPVSGSGNGLLWLVFLFPLFGLFLFTVTLFRSKKTLSRWRKTAKGRGDFKQFAHPEFNHLLSKCRIYQLPDCSTALSTGLVNREIWIGDQISAPEDIRTALNHELCHISSGDPLALHLIAFWERLFWWNPLIWILGKRAKVFLEYECDSRCKKLLGEEEYRKTLTKLLLINRHGSLPLELSLGAASEIVKRMENLQMKYSIKKKHIFGAIFTACTILGASTVLGKSDNGSLNPTFIDCKEFLPDGYEFQIVINSRIDTKDNPENEKETRLALALLTSKARKRCRGCQKAQRSFGLAFWI